MQSRLTPAPDARPQDETPAAAASPRPRSSVGLGIVAGLLGSSWGALLQIAAVPLYLRFLGPEAYGLVGFHVALTSALQVLDLGLSATLNRELARATARPTADVRDLVRTLELGYGALGLLLGATLALLSPWIATHWVRASTLPVPVVQQAVLLMGALVALQWPLTMYHGGVMGLQRLVPLHALNAAAVTIAVAGGVAALAFVSPSITVLLAWQLLVAVLHLGASALLLWRSMPRGPRPTARPHLVRRIGGFAAGLTGITALGTLVAQADKIVLSRSLPLAAFGYYTLAATVAGGLGLVIAPIFNALYSRLSVLRALGDDAELALLYRRGTQVMTALLASLAAVLVAFAPELLRLWTRDAVAAAYAAPIARLLVVGAALHGIVHLPYALQLADGWTRLALRLNVAFVVLLFPLLLLLTPRYGGIAAGWLWIALNVVYLLVSVPLTHRRFGHGGALAWLVRDVAPPAAAAVLVTWAARAIVSQPASAATTLAAVAGGGALAALAAAFSASELRAALRERLLRARTA